MTESAATYVAGPSQGFIYEIAPLGRKVLLLTKGGVCVEGHWYGKFGEYFWAWCPLPPRDHDAEVLLGLLP